MKKMILCLLAGAIFSVSSSVTQADDCCCPQKKCWSLPKLKMPHLFSWCSKPKCDPCATACAAPAVPAATEAAPAPAKEVPAPPKEEAPKPTLSPSAAEKK